MTAPLAKGLAGANSIARLSPLKLIAPDTRIPFWATWSALATVEGSSGLPLVNRVITVPCGTPVAPLPGRMVTTWGALPGMSAAVWNLLWKSPRLLPERSSIADVATTVIVAPAGVVGVKVMVRLSAEKLRPPVPMLVVPINSWSELPFTVAWLIDFEKVSAMVALRPTPVALLTGVTEVTVSCVVSAVPAVVNVDIAYPYPFQYQHPFSVSPARPFTWHWL